MLLDTTMRLVLSRRAKESSWDLGTDERLASGIFQTSEGNEHALGELYITSQDQEESTSSSWRDQASGKAELF